MSTQFDTNKVLQDCSPEQSKPVYYIPGYFRLKVNNFTAMDLQNLNAVMHATIILSIYYGSMPQMHVQALKTDIVLLFGRDNALALNEKSDFSIKLEIKEELHQIQFLVRRVFQLRIESDVYYSPFQIINLILSITVQPVKTKSAIVKINLMNSPDLLLKLSYADEGAFGNYDLASTRMRSEYSNGRVCDVDKFYLTEQRRARAQDDSLSKLKQKSKIDQYQYAHFLVPLYKHPMVSLATIFLPLWLLAIINLGIFFQNTNVGDRIGSISGIMIAYVALIPTIRDNIPPNPKLVFIQILVYFAALTSLFSLIDTIAVRNNGQEYSIVWYESGLFLTSFIITIITVVVVIVLMFLHYVFWAPNYKLSKTQKTRINFDRKLWKNKYCDQYFNRLIKQTKGKIKLETLPDPVQSIKQAKILTKQE